MFNWIKGKKATASDNRSAYSTVMLKLEIDDCQKCFVVMSSDGGMTRCGPEGIMKIGQTDGSQFTQVADAITPELLNFFGSGYSLPEQQGGKAKLRIILEKSTGQELITEWQFGTETGGL